ncbi:hypothetical protein Patl1_28322 [Pistacia atlantica]|uniref:Uncharacterized protein n=1 Tax=Pistacia atlantica TaxID=434234 RepID=A0ACC1BBW9_9ROSI|nr:hypothetical protein Patl1_28322 [Pistacia atlantica]
MQEWNAPKPRHLPLLKSALQLQKDPNAPKPRHLPLFKSALQREYATGKQSDLWVPLVDQGWRPCVESAKGPL